MLTARIDREDRIAGHGSGADDYLPKPFDPDELLARIRAVLRRTEGLAGDDGSVKIFGDILVNLQTREAWSGGQRAELTAMEFDSFGNVDSCRGPRGIARRNYGNAAGTRGYAL